AADLQLRRDSTGRRRPLRVRRPGRKARDHGWRRRRGARRREERGGVRLMSELQADERKPLLVFVNEVAGGRKLLQAVRDPQDETSGVVVAAPQNQTSVGQLIDTDEVREAARARVEVTMALLSEFGIESVGEVMDPESSLALDDAVRAHRPGE